MSGVIDLTEEAATERVLSIDIGSKNLACCLMEGEKILMLKLANLNVPSKYSPLMYVSAAEEWLSSLGLPFGCTVLLERQMTGSPRRKGFSNANGHIHDLLLGLVYPRFREVFEILPKRVAAHWNIEGLTYAKKKRSGIEIVRGLQQSYPEMFSKSALDYFEACQKKDDLADCILQALFYQAEYKN